METRQDIEAGGIVVVSDAEARAAMAGALALARSLTGHEEAAQDLAQDAMLRCLTTGQREPDKPLLPYLIQAVRWLHIDRYRRDRRIAFTSIDTGAWEDGERVPMSLACDAPTPLDLVLLQEDRERVHAALDRMKPHLRRPLVLVFLEQRSYLETQAILGTSLGTVKSRVNRGRKDFLRCWAAQDT